MSATSLSPSPARLQPGVRRLTAALMYMSMGQLLLWLGTVLTNFYAGPRQPGLPVQAGLKFGASHQHLAAMLPSPAGDFSTGTQGSLLYQPTALSDYFLFYHLGSFTGLDAIFLAGGGLYLYRALGRRPAQRAFAPATSRALSLVAGASGLMYMLSLAVDALAHDVFQAKTQHLFTLGGQAGGSVLYVVLGLGLGVCGRFAEQGQQLQHENELTI